MDMKMSLEIPADEKTQWSDKINALAAQAGRAIVTDDDTFARSGDLMKMMQTLLKKTDEHRREEYTDKLNAVVKSINAEFKAMVAPLNEGISRLKRLRDDYAKEKEGREREERERLIREAEERALAEAAKLEKKGESEQADAIIEETAQAVKAARSTRPAPVRGDYGSTSSIRRTWTYELTDISVVPEAFLQVNEQAIKEYLRSTVAKLRMQATDAGMFEKEAEEFVRFDMERHQIPGIRFYQEVTSATR